MKTMSSRRFEAWEYIAAMFLLTLYSLGAALVVMYFVPNERVVYILGGHVSFVLPIIGLLFCLACGIVFIILPHTIPSMFKLLVFAASLPMAIAACNMLAEKSNILLANILCCLSITWIALVILPFSVEVFSEQCRSTVKSS